MKANTKFYSGKSHTGKQLAQLLGYPFVDLDDAIVEAAGRSIPEIFAQDGEATFRQLEREQLQAADKQAKIVSCLG